MCRSLIFVIDDRWFFGLGVKELDFILNCCFVFVFIVL